MKKILCAALAAIMLLSVTACGEDYEEAPLTDAEARSVLEMSSGDGHYTLNYALYRSLFYSLRDGVDGGDHTVWTGSDSGKYISEINALILAKAANIFAVFEAAERAGIDPYSKEIDEEVLACVRADIEGGYVGDYLVQGLGSYDAYISSLAESHISDYANRLLYRYSIVWEHLTEYYIGNIGEVPAADTVLGAISYTREDVENFYFGDDCRHIRLAFMNSTFADLEYALDVRARLMRQATNDGIVNTIMNYCGAEAIASEAENGVCVGRYSLDPYFSALTASVFSLSGERDVGEVIQISDVAVSGFYIAVGAEKSAEYLDQHYEEVARVYAEDQLGRIISGICDELLSGAGADISAFAADAIAEA